MKDEPTASKATETNGLDSQLKAAQSAYLDRVAPGHSVTSARWGHGITQVIEIGQGPPVLLVHGGLGEAFQWGPILSALARSHRVLAVDRPGHGLADPFDYRDVDMQDHACAFLGGVMQAAGLDRAPIVGASMGGFFAIAFAAAHPRRVTQLVLPGIPAGMTRWLPAMLRFGTIPLIKGIIRSAMRRPNRDAVRAFWKQLLVAHPERLRPDFLDLSVLSQQRNHASWFALLDRTVGPGGIQHHMLRGERWTRLSVPATVIWGDKDAFGAPSNREALEAIRSNPRARVVPIAGAGHAVWFDEPDAVAAAIQEALGNI